MNNYIATYTHTFKNTAMTLIGMVTEDYQLECYLIEGGLSVYLGTDDVALTGNNVENALRLEDAFIELTQYPVQDFIDYGNELLGITPIAA